MEGRFRAAARTIASAALYVAAGVYGTIYFVGLRVIPLLLAPSVLLLRWTRAARLFAAVPVASTLAASVGLVALGARRFDATFAALPHGRIVQVAAASLLLGVFHAGSVALVYERMPSSLEQVREAVKRWPERWFAARVANPLDAYFVRSIVNHSICVVPAVVGVVVPGLTSPASCALLLVANMIVGNAHEVLDHTNLHNHFFRPTRSRTGFERAVLRGTSAYLDYVLNPMCTRIPNWYRVQHLAVHHAEDNGVEDTQSTVTLDRASFLELCRLGMKLSWSVTFAPDVVAYLVKKRRFKPLRALLFGMGLYYATLVVLAWVNPAAAAFLLALRFLEGPQIAINAIQWHGFVDVSAPENAYRNSVNHCSGADHANMGADLHVEHHLHPAHHWTELLEDAKSNGARYASERVLVLRPPDTTLFKALWTHRFAALRPYVVSLGREHEVGDEDVARLVEERTRPLGGRRVPAFLAPVDAMIGRAMAFIL